MRSFLADLRYGLRGLAKNPGFAAPAIATLALGIGATVAIFGVVDAVLLKPLPHRDPDRLAHVGSMHPVKNANGFGASYVDFRDWRDRNRSFEKLAGREGSRRDLPDLALGGLRPGELRVPLGRERHYGVIAYTVTRRRYEIGVRMAMGASPREVLRLFVGGGLRLAAAGVGAGLAAALAATTLLDRFLYGVAPRDPATFAGAALLLLAVACLASVVPARRAASTDPLVALRSE